MKCFKKLKSFFHLNRKERKKDFETSMDVCGDTYQRDMDTNKLKRFNRSKEKNITKNEYEDLQRGYASFISTEVQNFLVARGVKMNSKKRDEIEEIVKILSKLHPELGFKLTFNPFDFRDEDLFITILFLNGKRETLSPNIVVRYDEPKLFKI